MEAHVPHHSPASKPMTVRALKFADITSNTVSSIFSTFLLHWLFYLMMMTQVESKRLDIVS